MSIKKQYIPAPLASAVKGGYVTDASEILDENKGKRQDEINQEIDSQISGIKGGSAKSITELDTEIQALEKQDIVPVDELPAVATADPKKIYRVVGETSYIDYMVNAAGDGWKELAEYSFPGLDEEPTPESDMLVTSGGIADTYGYNINNEEYKEVNVDGENKIYENIDADDVKNHFLKEKFHNIVVFDKEAAFEESVTFKEQVTFKEAISPNDYTIESDEYSELTVDNENKVLDGRKVEDGSKHIFTPVTFHSDVKIEGNHNIYDINSVVSEKFAKVNKRLDNVLGTVWQNNRNYTTKYSEIVYNELMKSCIGFHRDYNSGILDGNSVVNILYKNNINILALPQVSYLWSIENIENIIADIATNYDGDEHEAAVFNGNNGDIIIGSSCIAKCKIDYINLFNEPDLKWNNLPEEERTQEYIETYFEAVKAAYIKAKSIRPEVMIVGGVFADLTSEFVSRLFTIRDEGGKAFWDYCDIIDFHHYSSDYSSLEAKLKTYKAICNNVYSNSEYSHLKDKPLWMSEFGTTSFTDANAESIRHKLLPKQALTYLSYGIEKVFAFRLMSFNMFVSTFKDNYYGFIIPNYRCAYAGFTFADSNHTSLTPDGLLNKTYIHLWQNRCNLPFIETKDIPSRNQLFTNGLSFNGKGFTATRIIAGTKCAAPQTVTSQIQVNDEVWIDNISILWSGSTVMNGTNHIDIAGDTISGLDLNNIIIAVEINDVTMTDESIDSFTYTDSYYSIKFLASVLSDIEQSPNIIKKTNDYTLINWKTKNGTYSYAIWSNSGNINISFDVTDGAEFYDVKGNRLIEKPSVISDAPIYIVNSKFLNIYN